MALLLDDVPGGHPDLADDEQMADLLAATDQLVARLGRFHPADPVLASDIGVPGVIDARARFRDWVRALDHLDELPDDLVPASVRQPAGPPARALVAPLAAGGPTQLLHWDIRIDNLLRPAAGRIVFVDWGAAAIGPSWVDPLLARLERVDQPWFDASLGASPALAEVGDDLVTGWLAAFGTHSGLALPAGLRRHRSAHPQRVPAYRGAAVPGRGGAADGVSGPMSTGRDG